MSDYLKTHRTARTLTLLVRRYFEHHVAHDSAALTYYLLFALFPLLIFFNNLVGLLSFDAEAFLSALGGIVPREVLELVRQYLDHISYESSQTLMWSSLVLAIYFPCRAVNALFLSVRKAYAAAAPAHFLRESLRVLLYTVLLIVTMALSVGLSAVGRRALEFVADYVYVSEQVIRLWSWLRFVFLGAVLFLMIALLYVLALDRRSFRRGIWPGVFASLTAWLGLSLLFSLYVERAAHYSLIYGSIGTIVVLLLWLYLSAAMLIMGAEFNGALLENETK